MAHAARKRYEEGLITSIEHALRQMRIGLASDPGHINYDKVHETPESPEPKSVDETQLSNAQRRMRQFHGDGPSPVESYPRGMEQTDNKMRKNVQTHHQPQEHRSESQLHSTDPKFRPHAESADHTSGADKKLESCVEGTHIQHPDTAPESQEPGAGGIHTAVPKLESPLETAARQHPNYSEPDCQVRNEGHDRNVEPKVESLI